MEGFRAELRSWEDMWILSKRVAAEIWSSGFLPDYVVAVVRGGMVPAMNLSDILDIKDILFLRVEHWGKTASMDEKAEIKTPPTWDFEGKGVLLVDDVVDTGDSMRLALEHLKSLNTGKVETAALIYKKQSSFRPDFYGEKAEDWQWTIFPWNLTEDLCNLVDEVSGGVEIDSVTLDKEFRERYRLSLDKDILRYALEAHEKRSSGRDHVGEQRP
ncbi:MAG: xanthine phosphoribosyltransferase [Candidatus Altiarchaeales archaeon ex4484_2]|nr:MAG: xanthine phosphoribosyltransferase [Candidatus Altiarchaeales archaeon ex4484_2]